MSEARFWNDSTGIRTKCIKHCLKTVDSQFCISNKDVHEAKGSFVVLIISVTPFWILSALLSLSLLLLLLYLFKSLWWYSHIKRVTFIKLKLTHSQFRVYLSCEWVSSVQINKAEVYLVLVCLVRKQIEPQPVGPRPNLKAAPEQRTTWAPVPVRDENYIKCKLWPGS